MYVPPCVYLLKNVKNGKIYVGRTQNTKERFYNHLSALRANRHTNDLLQEDFNKYGEESFVFEIEIYNVWNYERGYMEAELDTMIKYKTWDKKHGYNYKDRHFYLKENIPTKIMGNLTI